MKGPLGAWGLALALLLLGGPLGGMASAAVLPTTISQSTTLTAAQGPYTGTSVTVKAGVTLKAEPGTIIKLDHSLVVNGTLNLAGSAVEPVVITSLKDDSAGGDSNKDGAATKPVAGDWSKIKFNETGGGSIDYATIRYGGSSGSTGDFTTIMVECPCTNELTISNSSITHSKYNGIKTYRAKPQILGNNISDNGYAGLVIRGGSPGVTGNTISRNGMQGIDMRLVSGYIANVDIDENLIEENADEGIRVDSTTAATRIVTASLGGNTIRANGGKAVEYDAYSNPAEDPAYKTSAIPLNIDTNIVEGNALNGIWLKGELQESTTWQGNDYPIVVKYSSLAIGPEATLTLEPGVIIKGDVGGTIQVRGELVTNGNSETPVTFTSVKDDSVGGDTNGDGTASGPAGGDWDGFFYPVADGAEIEYSDIRYAEVAIDVEYLESMDVGNSDFTSNEKAFDVQSTAVMDEALAALECLPPYLAFIDSHENFFASAGLPAPAIDLSSVLSPAIPPEYALLFSFFVSQANATASLYGTDDTIPWAIYSCPPQKIPAVPMSPVLVHSTHSGPNFP
jgi:hypothetical protein